MGMGVICLILNEQCPFFSPVPSKIKMIAPMAKIEEALRYIKISCEKVQHCYLVV